jgi:hypothetical protein
MTDALLTMNDREEELSRAYVQAIAAAAGHMTAEFRPDRDGTDIQIRAGGSMRPSLDIQLKATINLEPTKEGLLRYQLKRRNYGLLRVPTLVPNILVILALPRDNADWVTVTAEQLVLRRCAYWVSLKGYPETENQDTVTIPVESENRFDVEALMGLMERARTGTVA